MKIPNKIRKMKKPYSGFIYSQNGMIQVEKERKKFLSRIPFILYPGMKIPNKIEKKTKKLKNLILDLFLAKTGWDRQSKREKKF